ncbi:MAG TPA: hypothetical protein VNG12_25665 [Acidimicrobiales bacterium]|nr:hypothetical protein [Acidimicrobiales bacterium]
MSRIWFSRRALALHAVIIVIVPAFMTLCIWQLRRALSGNDLSWAYVFEWPFFAGYAVYMWWRFVHDVEPDPGSTQDPPQGPIGGSEPENEDLAAYNRYLAALAAEDERKQRR